MDTDRLLEALGAVSAQLRLRYSSPEIGFVALATLRHLDRRGPKAVSELAQSDHVTTQAISLRVRPLVEAGLLVRTTDPADTRRTIVAITERGRAVVAAAQARTRTALQHAVHRLPEADRDQLAAVLPTLVQLADNLTKEPR
jgi:DNA-binding MarR family transcriptional regulator